MYHGLCGWRTRQIAAGHSMLMLGVIHRRLALAFILL
jgi:hypothetical protein